MSKATPLGVAFLFWSKGMRRFALFVGLLVCWFVGLLVCWFVGLLGKSTESPGARRRSTTQFKGKRH
jgi:hypothetical protein